MREPSKSHLLRVERELRRLPAGKQRVVSKGIYMRLDASGRRRFQIRVRDGAAQPSGTFDTWHAANDERLRLEEEIAADISADVVGQTVRELRRTRVTEYARTAWWPTVEMELDITTQNDYRRYLPDTLAVAGSYTLEALELSPMIVDEIKRKIIKRKTFPDGHRRGGELPKGAADKIIKILSAMSTHAVERGVMRRNPFLGTPKFNRKRSAGKSGISHRPVKPSEVKHPRTVAQAASGMRAGRPDVLEARRLIAELIAYGGYRPSDICAMRHCDWRDADGPLEFFLIERALKTIESQLVLGEPKTGERQPRIFNALVWQLERVYQAQGRPPLDNLVCPNVNGDFLRWGNFRDEVWYPALHRAGLAFGPTSGSKGAFCPYTLRHIAATTMTHAERPPELGGGTYSGYEVARHLGHTEVTLAAVYVDIPRSFHGIAGMTMDEIIWTARRHTWGPLPGQDDYVEEMLSTREASALTGIAVNALGARIARGSLPARQVGSRYFVSRFDLSWQGLLPPLGIERA